MKCSQLFPAIYSAGKNPQKLRICWMIKLPHPLSHLNESKFSYFSLEPSNISKMCDVFSQVVLWLQVAIQPLISWPLPQLVVECLQFLQVCYTWHNFLYRKQGNNWIKIFFFMSSNITMLPMHSNAK